MSILACLIGILTLMISVAMVAKEMERRGRTQEELDRALENRDIRREVARLREEKQNLEDRMKKERKTVAEMIELQDKKIVLRDRLDEIEKARDPEKTDAELQKIAENLKKEITALKKERPSLVKRLKELEQELKARKDQPEPPESVLVRPGGVGSRTARNIFFVECHSTGITLMEEDRPPVKISTAAIGRNDTYNKFLQEVKGTRDSMVLYLVRKAGNESYLWAAGHAESKFDLTTGKLPIPNDGRIDLSLFKN
jgi:chaperonin cofactor prefoldin